VDLSDITKHTKHNMDSTQKVIGTSDTIVLRTRAMIDAAVDVV